MLQAALESEVQTFLDQHAAKVDGQGQRLVVRIGDGALGFWAALRKIFPETKEQRCWVHKTTNVLNNLPKSVQPKAIGDLHEIWQAETRSNANKTFDHFLEKYQKACECLKKDDDELLAFYDFPAEHWGSCEPRTDRSLTPRTNIPSRKPDPRRQTTGVMINAHQVPNSTQPRTFSVAISSSNGLFETPDRLPTSPKPTTAGLLLPVGRDSWSRTELAFADVKKNRANSLPRNDLCFTPDPCNGFPYITVAG